MADINVRGIAALSMLQVVDNQKSLTGILAYQSPKVADGDRGLLQHLCFGACRHYFSINALSKMLLQKPLPEQARPVQALLWVGLYQLAHSDISEHAAINETVEACGQLKLDKYKGVLNAILRRFQREKTELLNALKDSDVPHFEHPKWYLKLLKKSWPEQWQTICQHANLQAPMCLRVNTQLQETDKYLLTLSESEIEASKGKYALTSIYLSKPCDVQSLPDFAQGSCSVQDEAAQLAAQLAAQRAEQRAAAEQAELARLEAVRAASQRASEERYARALQQKAMEEQAAADRAAAGRAAAAALHAQRTAAAAEEQARLEQQLAEQQAAGVALGAGRVSWIRGRAA